MEKSPDASPGLTLCEVNRAGCAFNPLSGDNSSGLSETILQMCSSGRSVRFAWCTALAGPNARMRLGLGVSRGSKSESRGFSNRY